MRFVLAVVFASALAFAQNATPQQASSSPAASATKQKMPSKSDPQGYSAAMFDDGKIKSDLGHPPAYTPPPDVSARPKVPEDLAAVVKAQFGPDFEIAMGKTTGFKYVKPTVDTWITFLTADMDGDGVEDAVIVARSSKPMKGQTDFHYTVVDPYFTYYGYGDPKITATLNSEDPSANFLVLIIHGAGAEGWRAAVPKSKYVVVNLPFDSLSITHIAPKKKSNPIAALSLDAIESSGSVIYWDGKKYKWKDVGAGGI
jgi:hypothetical protein